MSAAVVRGVLFPYFAREWSDFGAALPAETAIAMKVGWWAVLAFILVAPLALLVPTTFGRDATLIVIDLAGLHVAVAGVYLYLGPLYSKFVLLG